MVKQKTEMQKLIILSVDMISLKKCKSETIKILEENVEDC
jgi:hypothetical protein